VNYLQELIDLCRTLDLRPGHSDTGLRPAVYLLAELVPNHLPDAMISDLYRLADALILPSREEGFGIPVIEAGLSGLPIFSADLPILRELAGDLAYYFSPDGDPGMISGMIAETLKQLPAARMKVKIRREYSWDGVYDRKIGPLLEQVRTGGA
jgi:glycosyltransferase involved in cell wall biosynthesis